MALPLMLGSWALRLTFRCKISVNVCAGQHAYGHETGQGGEAASLRLVEEHRGQDAHSLLHPGILRCWDLEVLLS